MNASAPLYLARPGLPALAYAAAPGAGALPTVMFMGGFRSDMTGGKATGLEALCRARGQSFIRFDYRGHGASEGRFEDAVLGDWREDALAVLDSLTAGPVILAGSSMGGWLALLVALARPDRIAGIVGIAAAPDFTRLIDRALNDAQRRALAQEGFFELPTAYGEAPYRITARLLKDGENWCLLDGPVDIRAPVRLVQGRRDAEVPWQTAFALRDALTGGGEVIIVEDGEHRLSRPGDIALIDGQIAGLNAACTASACPSHGS